MQPGVTREYVMAMKTTHQHQDWIAGTESQLGTTELARPFHGRDRLGRAEDDAVARQLRDDWGFITRLKVHHTSARRHRRPGAV
jgi:hypothetical protein